MKIQFTKKNIYISVGIAVVTLFIFLAIHFLQVKPLEQSISLAENTLKTEKQLLETIKGRVEGMKQTTVDNTRLLQQRLPSDPLLEQFLIDLEKAEVVSGSFISSMNFGSGQVSEQELTEAQEIQKALEDIGTYGNPENKEEQETKADEQEGGNAENKAGADQNADPNVPEGVERLTVSLSVQSPSYLDMLEFLKKLEELKRITKIDTLAFAGNPEVTSIEQDLQELNFSLSLSTFYYPNLEGIKWELPPIDMPIPSNKKIPFPQTYDFNDGSPSTIQDDFDSDPLQEYDPSLDFDDIFIIHTVKENETLQSISIRYFGSERKVEEIKMINQIGGNDIYVGEELFIPKS